MAVATTSQQLGDMSQKKPMTGSIGHPKKVSTKTKAPTAEQWLELLPLFCFTLPTGIRRVGNVRHQSLQRLLWTTFGSPPIRCLNSPEDHPTILRLTHPILLGKKSKCHSDLRSWPNERSLVWKRQQLIWWRYTRSPVVPGFTGNQHTGQVVKCRTRPLPAGWSVAKWRIAGANWNNWGDRRNSKFHSFYHFLVFLVPNLYNMVTIIKSVDPMNLH